MALAYGLEQQNAGRVHAGLCRASSYCYCDCVSGKATVQNGTVSGQALDHDADTTAINGVLASDGDIVAAASEEDAAVSSRLDYI